MSQSESGGTDPRVLAANAAAYHYGYTWRGSHLDITCDCVVAACGLIERPRQSCHLGHQRIASAKQIHKATECPALG